MSYDFSSFNRYMSGTFSSTYALPLTVAMWIKCTPTQWNITVRDWAMIFTDDLVSADSSVYMSKSDGGADRVSATTRSASTFDADAHLDFTPGDYDNTWVCIIGTWTSTTRRDMYIESTSNTQSSTATSDPGSVLDSLIIGGNNTGTNNFSGLLGEFAMWDKVLSAGEINSLQTAAETGVVPSSVANANCIGYWPLLLDQATHADQSGNGGPTLTVNNAVFDADHPTITSDSGTVNTKTLTDSTAVNDTPNSRHSLTRPGDVVDLLTDATFLYTVMGRLVADNFSLQDAVTIMGSADKQLAELTTIEDVLTSIRRIFRSVSDNISGRINLGLWSNDLFSAWEKVSQGGIIIQNAGIAPNGLMEASEFPGDEGGGTSNSVRHAEGMIGLTDDQLYRYSLYVENVQGDDWIAMNSSAFVGASDLSTSFFDIENGVIGTVAQFGFNGMEAASISVPGAGPNWYRIWGYIRIHGDVNGFIDIYQRSADGGAEGERDNNSYRTWGWSFEPVINKVGTPAPLIETQGSPVALDGLTDSILHFQTCGRIGADNVLMTDNDIQQIERGKQLSVDGVSLTDGFQKLVTVGESSQSFVVILDDIVEIVDTQELFKSGVIVRDVSDSIAVDEFIAIALFRRRLMLDDIGMVDSSLPSKVRNRLQTESVTGIADNLDDFRRRFRETTPDNIAEFSDSQEGKVIRSRLVQESILPIDNMSFLNTAITNAIHVELLTVTDIVFADYFPTGSIDRVLMDTLALVDSSISERIFIKSDICIEHGIEVQ